MKRLWVTVAVLLSACSTVESEPAPPASLDYAFYRCRVEPVVVERCGFFACHGDPSRPYLVFGPNRMRLDVTEAERALAITDAETRINYESAVGFALALDATGYDEPLLVAKPLDERVGGAYHEGAELYGGADVFTDPADPDLEVLRRWVAGATEAEDCVP